MSVEKEIIIKNKSYGELNGVKIFLTSYLYQKLSKEKNRDGVPYITLLRNGTFIRGLKHLITLIKQNNPNNKIILTEKETKVEEEKYYINYENYRNQGQKYFMKFYRETGLISAQNFLAKKFPQTFAKVDEKMTNKEIKKVERELPKFLQNISKKIENKEILIEQTSNVLKELREEKRELRRKIKGLKELQRQSNIYFYKNQLEEFKNRLRRNIHETRGKDCWQNWIYNNSWLFGIHYQEPIQKERIGFDNIPDFLFPTLDGFLDILEIKKPSHNVIKRDQSHAGSYLWSPETNRAIGQVIRYITEMELHQLELKERINREYDRVYESRIYTIKPRAFILIGKSNNWTSEEKEAFRKLNYSLHGIEILTYTDLYSRGERIVQMYTDNTR